METLRRENTLQAAFLDSSAAEDDKNNTTWSPWGYLTFFQESEKYYLSFTETPNPVKKTAHLAVESADMAPEVAKMTWRYESLIAKSFMGIRPEPWQKTVMKESDRKDRESLKEKMARHRSENFGMNKLETCCFEAEITHNLRIVVVPGKEKINALGISGFFVTGYQIAQCDWKHNRDIAYFRLGGSVTAEAWANLIKSKIPGVVVNKEDARDIFHRI